MTLNETCLGPQLKDLALDLIQHTDNSPVHTEYNQYEIMLMIDLIYTACGVQTRQQLKDKIKVG